MMSIKNLLRGKTAVITGGGRGIGQATAFLLAREGVSVFITSRTENELTETVEKIREEGGKGFFFCSDVTDWESVLELKRKSEEEIGIPDILIINAGMIKPIGDTWTTLPTEWARNIAVNLIGAYYSSRAYLPSLISRGTGTVIFVSSGVAERPQPGWTAYCAAKAGLEHYIRTLRAEIDENPGFVRVHGIRPGIVNTQMQANIRAMSPRNFPGVKKYRQYAQNEMLRPPEEPAQLILWLSTSYAEDYHGKIVSIDNAEIRNRVENDLKIGPLSSRK